MSDQEKPPEDNFGWIDIGDIRESEASSYNQIDVKNKEIQENFHKFYRQRNRDQIFILLDRAKENIQELFPDEDNPEETYDNLSKRIIVEQIALFCQAAEDLGGIMFSVEHSEDQEEFAKYLKSYHASEVRETFEKFLNEDLDSVRPFMEEILNLPEPEDDEDAKQEVELTYENFFDLVEGVAENYLEFADVYNAYKHGYRIFWGTSQTVTRPPSLLGKWSMLEYIVDSPAHDQMTFMFLTNSKMKAFTFSEEKHDELRKYTSEADNLIKLLRDNFKWRETEWFRRISEEK